MNQKMPGRPKSHDNAEASRRAFESAIPSSWTFTSPSGDYGIDGDIEVFENHAATGIHFRVQLKSVELVRGTPKVSIQQSTRDYWAQLDVPTLVVLWEAATKRLWWQWAHLIDDWKSKPGAKSLSVKFDDEWSEDSSAQVLEEVRAFRALRNFGASVPIYVEIEGPDLFLGERPGPLIARTQKVLGSLKDLTFVRSKKKDLTLAISFSGDTVAVRLSGSHPRYVHYGDESLTEDLMEVVIGNIMVSVAFALGKSGLVATAAALLASSAGTAASVFRPDLLGTIIESLATAHETQALRALIQRTYLWSDSPVRELALFVLVKVADKLDGDELRAIVADLEAAAPGLPDGDVVLYNAAGLLRRKEPVESRKLYEAAAEVGPAYKRRGYWWKELGATYYAAGDFETARTHYEKAIDLGELSATAFLADAKLRLGLYTEAVELYIKVAEDETLTDARSRLHAYAFSYVIADLEIETQERNTAESEAIFARGTESDSPQNTRLALQHDLLNAWALWRLTLSEREAGKPTLQIHLAAALSAPGLPWFWEEALRTAFVELPEMSVEIIEVIKRECRDDFVAFLHDDDHVDNDFRKSILFMLDYLPDPEDEPFILRDVSGETVRETRL